MYTRWLILAFISGALSLVLVVRHANAHGGVIRNADLCLIKIGYLEAHFKIYLPRSNTKTQDKTPIAAQVPLSMGAGE